MYNWGGGGGYIAGNSAVANIIGNYFISGPSTSVTAFTRGNESFHGYVEGNYYGTDQDRTLNGFALKVDPDSYSGMVFTDTKYDYPAVATVLTAHEAVKYVTTSAGAPPARDSTDTPPTNEVNSWGTKGALISDETASPMNRPREIDGGTAAVDMGRDGIPDDAEAELGTDPAVADSMQLDASGYTYLEVWPNTLVPSSYV
ncbi:hypothetical protein FQN53_004821 [Emmonsiellopsis sp. PD_33]|nr:hypothetical protein FQN53_004821 [Emmonsiellopsis sp. PD_33]